MNNDDIGKAFELTDEDVDFATSKNKSAWDKIRAWFKFRRDRT